jgi:hypothetical protein
VGENELYAVAEDKADSPGKSVRSETRYPADPQEFHAVTLDAPADLEYVFDAGNARLGEGAALLGTKVKPSSMRPASGPPAA